jgi:hypothetical protein
MNSRKTRCPTCGSPAIWNGMLFEYIHKEKPSRAITERREPEDVPVIPMYERS